MAQAIPEAKLSEEAVTVRVGKQVIDILTTGMYSNPLMALREYVQNAVDAIDDAVEAGFIAHGDGAVKVTLDGSERSLRIEDNGIGVPNDEVVATLCSLGCSDKDGVNSRGFRGIGRLGGMGYCEHLRFETRSKPTDRVATVDWDCQTLRHILVQKARTPIEEALERVVTVTLRNAGHDDPKRFMRVTLTSVRPFHRDELMNPPAVGAYLSQVAPVPFDMASFQLGADVQRHIRGVRGYQVYNMYLNGQQVFRPHTTRFEVSAGQADAIHGIETFEVYGGDGQSLGRGWYAKTSCLASIPPRVKMRGIRVRQGNIEVGGEYFLEDAFTERRFATWHIGEIHLDQRLKTNARRDGFEQSPDCEAFLEQAAALGKHLSQQCRSASKWRSDRIAIEHALCKLESATARNLFVDQAHYQKACAQMVPILKRLHGARESALLDTTNWKRLHRCERQFSVIQKRPSYLHDAIDGRTVRNLDRVQILTACANAILKDGNGHGNHEDLARSFLAPYLKPCFADR